MLYQALRALLAYKYVLFCGLRSPIIVGISQKFPTLIESAEDLRYIEDPWRNGSASDSSNSWSIILNPLNSGVSRRLSVQIALGSHFCFVSFPFVFSSTQKTVSSYYVLNFS